MWKLSESYTTEASILFIEAVHSYFHLYWCDYHYNRIAEDPLAVGIFDAVDDSIANYLEYYD
jgi:hypothetical protein